jgi:hypothetical protein
VIVGSANGPYSLPYMGLTWQDDQRELAMRVVVQVPDEPDDNWDPNLVADGQPFILRAGPKSAPVEVVRGRFKGHSFGMSQGVPIGPRGYSLLYDMLQSREDVVYDDSATGAYIIKDLCSQFQVPIGTIDGPTVVVGPMVGRRKQIADVFVEVLKRARGAGDGSWVMRWEQDGFHVVRPGGNKVVYWFVEGESILGGSGDSSIEKLITRVRVVRLESTKTVGALERDQYGRFKANTEKAVKANDIATINGHTEFGILQEVVYAKKGATDEEAITMAHAVLDMYGSPIITANIVVPLLPDIKKGDKHHITTPLFDGYMFVLGLSADAGSRSLHLDLSADWKDPFDMPSLVLDPEADTDTGLPTAATAGFTASKTITPQTTGWTCSAASSAWLLQSLGIAATEADVVKALGNPDGINESVGLTDGSGATLSAVLAHVWNLNTRHGAVTFDQVAQLAGKLPVIMGGQAFNHWVGVNGANGDTLTLANPGLGWMGITTSMTREQFSRLGPFYAVWDAA